MDRRVARLNQATVEILVDTWIRYEQTTLRTDHDNDFWAVMKLEELCRSDPTQALDVILEILQKDASGSTCIALATGPLEDLLVYRGPEIMTRIEHEAAHSPTVRALLGRVPKQRLSETISARVDGASVEKVKVSVDTESLDRTSGTDR